MQLLLTAGLAVERSSRATNMVYSEMLFALAFDKMLWGITPSISSIAGGGLILGSTIYVAVQKARTSPGEPSINLVELSVDEENNGQYIDGNHVIASEQSSSEDEGNEAQRLIPDKPSSRSGLPARSRSNLALDGHRMGSRERRKSRQEKEIEVGGDQSKERQQSTESQRTKNMRRRNSRRDSFVGISGRSHGNGRLGPSPNVFDEEEPDRQ
ncbi:hypothetical protein MMC25_007184 [Agyrium rufum]|nr:hypothetical protein [Agyrium rufum]